MVQAPDYTIDTRPYRRRQKDVFMGIRLPQSRRLDLETFTRIDLEQAFQVNRSIISKEASALGLRERDRLSLNDAFSVYVSLAWRRINGYAHRKTYLEVVNERDEFGKNIGDLKVLSQIAEHGYSRQHFEELIEVFLAKVRTSKLIV